MSAVISGNGLGLFNSPFNRLGGAQVGQGGDRQYVNVATGNLVLQSVDEFLTFRGSSLGQARTYNSLGSFGQAGGDGWQTGFERRVELLSGTFDTAGSVMRRHTGDGAYQDFVYVASGVYRSTDGDGAHDTLTWGTGDAWHYLEGSTRRGETYADHQGADQGRLIALRDGSTSALWTVVYDAGRISEIRAVDGTSNGDGLVFGYHGSGSLASVSTRENGVVVGQVEYGYEFADGTGRLMWVQTDLTPGTTADNAWNAANAAANDGHLFRTSYTYVGASLQIASVTQSDGSVVSYTYYGDSKLKTVTRGDTNTNDADGSGETLTYTYGTGATTVTDSLGRSWIYGYDAQGHITIVTSPPVAGQSDVSTYAYDAEGNLVQAKSVRGAATLSLLDYAYDANGNLLWQWDAQGNAIQRTYDAANQILSETRYTDVDPDRSGMQMPTGGLTTRYVYDEQERLRFVVDATGSVREIAYASSGPGVGQQTQSRQYLSESYAGATTLAELLSWSSSRKAASSLVQYSYDLWGRLSQTTAYAAVDSVGDGVLDAATDITRFTYDAQGLLRQQITVRGAARTLTGNALAGSEEIDYVYDGLGRLLSVLRKDLASDAGDDAGTILTTYAYTDSAHQIAVQQDGGALRLETRDAAGRLISLTTSAVVSGAQVTRTERNYYDDAGQLRAYEDAQGARTYYFYDEKGRREATVDPTGAIVRVRYDGFDRITDTARYANRVLTVSWLVAGEVTVPDLAAIGATLSPDDRFEHSTYDAAGRLSTTFTDATGSFTRYFYDAAGRLLAVKRTDAAQSEATARNTRYFYDDAGRQTGVLDAEGYLTETVYDAGGRPIQVIKYANVAPSAQWAEGTLAQLRPAADVANDQIARSYYDGRGRRTGELDAAGYLTEWIFDDAGNVRAERRYASAVTWQAGDTLASLRTRAGSQYHESRMAYNGLGQLLTQTNAEGTVTRYGYDEAGRLLRTDTAKDTSEVRSSYRRYNAFDELIGEISAEGAANASTALLGGKSLDDPSLSQVQLDQAYAAYGVRHGYDALGRRTETIDAAGNKSWYFYDANGRLRYVARGVADLGGVANAQTEIQETRYNAFGESAETIAYTGRITLAAPGNRSSAEAAIAVLNYVAATDRRRQYAYDTRGLLASVIDAEGVQNRYTYNAFGELSREERAFGTTSAVTIDSAYDNRGLLTSRTEAVGTAVARTTSQVRDAFGRIVSQIDARGNTATFAYDRLGRQLSRSQTVQGRSETSAIAYDAFGRTLTTTDALGRTNVYTYDDVARGVSVTTPEGVTVTTTHNRHGQTVGVSQTLPGGAIAATTYLYDSDGRLVQTNDALGRSSSNEYDVRGLLSATVDGSGRRTELRYDAVGRTIRRIEDPTGLALTTVYGYDGQGRQLTVTDASGRTTGYAYDREGRLTEVARDPAGSNVRTTYAYDAQGRRITVTEGAGTAAASTIRYDYDALGRRISETADPAGLNLVTAYAYDANDNVVRRTDATGQVTRYYYDQANRLTHTVDPLGAITRQWYDLNGRVVAVRTFGQALNTSTLTDATPLATLDALLDWQTSPSVGEFRIYDGDGRLRFVVSSAGAVQESIYDSAGRLVATRRYAASMSASALQTLQPALLAGTALPSQINAAASRSDVLDQIAYRVLDAAGQVLATVDNVGAVSVLSYDAAGRLVQERRYSHTATLSSALRTSLLSGSATLPAVTGAIVADAAADLVAYRVYDGAGRQRYAIDAYGAVREILVDGAGRAVGSRAFASTIAVDAGLKAKLTAGDPTALADVATKTAAIANDARDAVSYEIYDKAGFGRVHVDSNGYVTVRGYDAAGRLVSETRFAQSAALSAGIRTKLANGTATVEELLAATPANAAVDRTTRYVVDQAGRTRYILSQDSATTFIVAERFYDALGRLVQERRYATALSSATPTTLQGVASAITAAGGDAAAEHRATRYVYDADGRLRFTIDHAGAVVENRYDGLDRVVETRTFGGLIPVSTAATEQAVAAAVASFANVRVTRTGYDGAGRVATVTDALNKTEYFGYDALGQRTSYTDKLNHVWTYGYDATGRKVSESGPPVQVATVNASGTVTLVTRAIITRFAYDALGNVLGRTENADTTEARTTQHVYDNRGNQIRTVFPDAWQVNASGQLEASGVTTQIEVTYDALGRAAVQKDVRGNYSYKIYNALGQIAFEVDQEGYVTGFSYDAFGAQIGMRRYATKINTAAIAGWTAGSTISLTQIQGAGVLAANANADRVLTTSHDLHGNKRTVVQSQVSYVKANGTTATGSPTTEFEFDAYGNLMRESVLLEGAAGQAGAVWAHTFNYYDSLGRKTSSVDAEGFVTAWQYNARGELAIKIEFARAINTSSLTTTSPPSLPAAGDAATGYDRSIVYTYDSLGRKASETVLRLFQRADSSGGVRNVATSYGYDAEDHLITTVVDGVVTTEMNYDALGRTISVTEAERQVLASNWQSQITGSGTANLSSIGLYALSSPHTAMNYDAFGNAVRITRYAKGKPAGGNPDGADTNNQVTTLVYDRQGRAVISRDALGNFGYSRYDAADHLIENWYRLNGSDGRDVTVRTTTTYDKVGQQLTSLVTRQPLSGGTAVTESQAAVRYNAFGEILAKGKAANELLDVSKSAQFEYDAAGRMIRSNSEAGVYRRYGYNLAGYQNREERDWLDGTTARIAVHTQTTDKLGRTVKRTLPSYTANAAATATLLTKLDRWGNVLEQIDPRGYVTQYAYNDRNQMIRQVAPLVEAVAANGTASWVKPETRWMYDALGRLVATRDPNGNVDRYEYDVAGKQIRSVEATGSATLQAYDALGRPVVSQSPLGYLTYVDYDRLDNAVAQGDFLLTAAGTARTKTALQRFALNQNGDRLSVTDAMGRVQKYDYDSRGLLLRSETGTGVVMQYGYDAQGKKISELDELGKSNTWVYDYFGRTTDHVDLGGGNYDYTYDASSGQLKRQTSNRTQTTTPVPGGRDPWDWDGTPIDPIVLTEQLYDRKIEYYANGQIRKIWDGDIFYAYQYDASGNRTVEETKTVDGRGMTIHVRTTIAYDAHNRVSRVTSDDLVTGQRTLDLIYEYDAAGNRRHVVANSGYGPGADPVSAANRAPELVLPPQNQTLKGGIAAQWRIRASDIFRDPEGATLTYLLKLSDGSALPAWLAMSVDTATGQLVFSATAGSSAAQGQTLTLKLTATDASGLATSANFTLKVVTNSAPVVISSATPTFPVKVGNEFAEEFQISEYFRDPDINDTLTIEIDPLSAGAAAWLTVDNSTPGVIRLIGTPQAAQIGTYAIVLRVRDSSGATVTKTINVQVSAKQAPVPVAQAMVSVITGRNFSLEKTLPQLFSDPNGDPIVVSAVLEDGTPLPGWMNFQYLQDSVPPLMRLIGNPPATEPDGKIYRIKLVGTDSDGLSANTILQFKVNTNRAPTVLTSVPTQNARMNNAYSATFSFASLFDDLENDYLVYTMTASDSRLNWLSYTTNAGQGTFTLSGTPTTNTQAGNYTVTIRATDVSGASVNLVINFHVVGRHPPTYTAGSINPPTAYANVPYSYQVPANAFVDADGDPLTFTVGRWWTHTEIIWDPVTNERDWIDVTERAALPSWMTFNAATRTFSGTPTETGDWDLYIIASESAAAGGGSVEHGFGLTVAAEPNYAPVVSVAIPNQTAAATGSAWSFAFAAGTFTDPNGAALTYTASGMPSWMTFNAATRTFSGTPSTVGTWNVVVRATDPGGLYVTDTFTVTTANVAPIVATPLPNMTATVGTAWSNTIPAGTFVDRNGQALTYTVSGMPSWLSFNASTRTFSGTPTGSGTYTISVTASDGSLSVADSFTLTANAAANLPPVVSHPLVNIDGSYGVNYTFAANTFTDPNGDTLTYTASGVIAGVTFNPATRNFSGMPTVGGGKYGKYYTVTVTASDGRGGSVSDSFTIYMEGYMDPPGGDYMTAGLMDSVNASMQQYEYDELAAPEDQSGSGVASVTSATSNSQELWFTYDAENRVQVVNGSLVSGQIVATGDRSYALQYNAAGQVVSKLTNEDGTQKIARSTYTSRGLLENEYFATNVGANASLQVKHGYDASGRETVTQEYFAPGTTRTYRTGNPNYPDTEWITVNISGWLAHSTQYEYDADGRVTKATERGRPIGPWVAGVDNADGSVDAATVAYQSTNLAALSLKSYVHYTKADATSGYDSAGRLIQYRYERLPNSDGTGGFTHTYSYTYEARESYLEKSILGTSTNPNYYPTTSTSIYDPYGRRVAVQENTPINGQAPLTRLRIFSYDADGGILTRRDGRLENGVFTQAVNTPTVKKPDTPFITDAQWAAMSDSTKRFWAAKDLNQHFVYVNGQQVARLSETGVLDVATQLTAYDSSEMGTEAAMVLEGDTLRSIAQRVYGNASLWYVLAEANAINDDSELVPGTTLKAPAVKTTANDAATFKPYDPAAIIGDTTPSLPYITPPPADKQHCNALATILIVVIAVIVTVYTAGAAAGAMGTAATGTGAAGTAVGTTAAAATATTGTFATGVATLAGGYGATAAVVGGAVGGFAGSVASQAVGSTMGETSFSWRNAFVNGAVGGVTAGFAAAAQTGALGPMLANNSYARAAATATAGQLSSYAASRAAGLNVGFSWKAVAASAVSAAITTNMGGVPLANGGSSTGSMINDFGGRFLNGAIDATTRRLMGMGEQDWGGIAADAFGNALGNAVVRSAQNLQADRAEARVRNAEQIEADQRIMEASTASTNGAGGKTDPLDLLRRSDDFQSALDKLGSDAKVLYDTEVWGIAENAKNGMGMTLDVGSGLFGSNRVALSADETSALSQFMELSGAVTHDADGSVAASMALVARSGVTLDQVSATIQDTLGRFVTDWDVSGLTQNLAVRNGVVISTGALNLMPLQDAVIERFNISVFGSPGALAAAERYEKASVALINPHGESGKTFKQQALNEYQAITGSIRDRLIDNGYLPKRIAYSERMTDVYKVIGDMMLGVVPAERLLAPLLRSVLGVARGLLPQVAANSVTGRVLGAYQRFYDDAFATAQANYASGRLRVSSRLNPTTAIGNHADRIATDRLTQWLEREGLSSDVLVNRRLRDPGGSGAYRRPDLRIPSENTIIDGTIGIKTLQTPQVRDFIRYSQGNTVIIVRPNELPTLLYAGGRP